MFVRILDLDGSVAGQESLIRRYGLCPVDLKDWGPRIRLACRFGRFRQFEAELGRRLGPDFGPMVTLYGSGDFHHVSLALLRRLAGPFNLLILDKHPDWMRRIPFLHCGTWVYHAAQLPQVQRVFHVGGELDFDNGFRRLAPWRLLSQGKITVFPACRSFRKGRWQKVSNEPLRARPSRAVDAKRMGTLLAPFSTELTRYPLYISLDKDVMNSQEAVVNWDSGCLGLGEMLEIVKAFLNVTNGNLAGMDLLGDWSPVRVQGLFRRLLHWTEHPRLEVKAGAARERNQRTNASLLKTVQRYVRPLLPAVAG